MQREVASLLILLVCVAFGEPHWHSVFHNEQTRHYYVRGGKWPTATAWGYYGDEVNQTGWARLYITTNDKFDDEQQSYCAGYLEGAITSDRIWQSYYNYVMTTFSNGVIPEQLTKYILTNLDWMNDQILRNDGDPYWQQVASVLQQIQGITDGYNDHCEKGKELTLAQQILQNADGDLEDLIPALVNTTVAQYPFNSHCSSIIKPTADKQELFSGHTTWSGFVGMLRTYKIYTMNLHNTAVLGKVVSFSSYPAYLGSVDDFYITSSGLSVIETTNGVFNTSLYQYITTESVLSWIRVIVANRLAKDGKSWTEIFAKYNSGTYNNQWIVTNYNKFQPGAKLRAGTLWILEQIPGYCESADVTGVMEKQGYWGSYNIPYFPYIFNISGFAQMVKTNGDAFSYTKCPRAQIFKREHSTVNSVDHMKFILRFNQWQTDPFSLHDPGNSISSRFDLEPSQPSPFGGLDSKLTSYHYMKTLTAEGISGPTYYQQPVFEWDPKWSTVPHEGIPNRWDFGWETFSPVSVK